MTELDIKNKNKVLIDYLRSIVNGFIIRAEYSTYDEDKNVIVVQEESGIKIVFFEADPIYNYYNVDIFGDNIQTSKNVSVDIGNLIGKNIYFDWEFINKNKQKSSLKITFLHEFLELEFSLISAVHNSMSLECIFLPSD